MHWRELHRRNPDAAPRFCRRVRPNASAAGGEECAKSTVPKGQPPGSDNQVPLHACVQECARYLETYKAYETKPADLIQGRTDEDYLSKLNAALTAVRGVNRTDVLTLAGAFRCLLDDEYLHALVC